MYGFEEFEEFREFEQIIQNVDQDAMFMVMGMMGLIILVVGIALLVGYVLRSIGLHTMAKNRGIKNPWLAWLPVGNYWIAGSIADQYRYVTKGEVTNRRKILLILGIATIVLSGVTGGVTNAMLYMGEDAVKAALAFEGIVALVSRVLGIATFVFWQIAMYDLYTSCNPEKNVLFLVLGIIFGFLEPFFIFFNRNREWGMPPRRAAEAEPVYDTVYQTAPEPTAEPRTYQDPWENV